MMSIRYILSDSLYLLVQLNFTEKKNNVITTMFSVYALTINAVNRSKDAFYDML